MLSTLQPFPEARIDESYVLTTNDLLDHLVSNGNMPARFRREELERLNQLLHNISSNPEEVLLEGSGSDPLLDPQLMSEGDSEAQDVLYSFQGARQGVSPNQVLNVATLFESYDCPTDVDSNLLGDTAWLWGT
jgi:proline utilization trans-activator